MDTLVIDTGPLTHTSRAGEMEVLERVLAPWTCVYPPRVYAELDGYDGNQSALQARWITVKDLDLEHDLLAAEIKSELGGEGTKNLGEAQCIALALQLKGETYIDDLDGNYLADGRGLSVWTTTELLVKAVRVGRISAERAASYLQALIDGGYKGLDVPSGQAFLSGYLPRDLRS